MASKAEAFELLSSVASGIIVAIVVCARAMKHASSTSGAGSQES